MHSNAYAIDIYKCTVLNRTTDLKMLIVVEIYEILMRVVDQKPIGVGGLTIMYLK